MSKKELLVSEKEKLTQIRGKIEKQQKIINMKERSLRRKRFFQLGDLLNKAGLAEENDNVLFGAFLEIKELLKNKQKVQEWTERHLGWANSSPSQRLIVSFKENLPEDALQSLSRRLREKKFKWYPFRKEWYGFGKKEEIQHLLGNDYVETIEASS